MKRKVIAAILALVMAIGMAVPAMAAGVPSGYKSPIWTVTDTKQTSDGTVATGTMDITITLGQTKSSKKHQDGTTETIKMATVKFSNGSTISKYNGASADCIVYDNGTEASMSLRMQDGFLVDGYYYSVIFDINAIGTSKTIPATFLSNVAIELFLNESQHILLAGSGRGETSDSQWYTATNITIIRHPAKRTASFTDVAPSQWYYNPIQTAYSTKLVEGASVDTSGKITFLPNDNLTLAQCLTLVSRIDAMYEGETIRSAKAGEQWYEPYVEYATNHGLFPSSLRSMAMNKYVTRGEFAAIAAPSVEEYIVLNSSKKLQQQYSIPDVAANTKHAQAIYILYAKGIAAGNDTKGTYNPDSKLTRAEATTILSRITLYGNRVDTSHLKK